VTYEATSIRRARVFISCGQTKDSDELHTAEKIAARLKELGYDPYVAVQEQTLNGLTENIFPKLRDYEYFVFVDFKREKLVPASGATLPEVHRGSLFSHQELAIAAYLKMPLLAFQEKGVKTDDGVLRFLQANATLFTDRTLLPNVIADEIQRRGWNPHLRNELVLERTDPTQSFDHHAVELGVALSKYEVEARKRRFYYVAVHNLHHHKIAMNCYVYLENVRELHPSNRDIPFRSVELKWSGYTLPNAHIVPESGRPFDAIAIWHVSPTRPSLVTFSDSQSFGYIPINDVGEYELHYAVVSDNFPIARACFTLSLSAKLEDTKLTLNVGR
jgi:hypothetical protein